MKIKVKINLRFGVNSLNETNNDIKLCLISVNKTFYTSNQYIAEKSFYLLSHFYKEKTWPGRLDITTNEKKLFEEKKNFRYSFYVI